jgi:hypothetical protein
MSDSVFEHENKAKSFELKKDLVFQKGKAVESKIISSPIFNNALKQYGAEGAKTIILQELIKMSEDEILKELKLLSSKAEENVEIKRSLRATKFFAIQWIEDQRRDKEIKEKCQFIVDNIPTFKISEKTFDDNKSRGLKLQKNDQVIKEEEKQDINIKIDIDKISKNRPMPIPNPKEEIDYIFSDTQIKIDKNEKILVITDIQGNYDFLKDLLLKNSICLEDNKKLVWNKNQKSKLVIVGDIFNKSPFSAWSGEIHKQTFQIIETLHRLVIESNNSVFITLGNFDLSVFSYQIFYDLKYGLLSKSNGIKLEAQIIPAIISFLENTAFDTENNIYSIWEKDKSNTQNYIFKLKNSKLPIRIKANEILLPDITSIRNFFLRLYDLILNNNLNYETLSSILISKENEDIFSLKDNYNRIEFFKIILENTCAINFLKKRVSAYHTFITDKNEKIKFFHVSLDDQVGNYLEKNKKNNWSLISLEDLINNSKFLKTKNIDTKKLLNILYDLKLDNVQKFLTIESEEFYELLEKKNLLDFFVPSISPNKLKFGFVKSLERLQETLKQEDKNFLLGFKFINRENILDFNELKMKKISELNDDAKKSYAEKILSDIFGKSSDFKINIDSSNKITCKKPFWNIIIEIDKISALYEDLDKNIHVPIKHSIIINYG